MGLITNEDLERQERERIDGLAQLAGYGPRTTTGLLRSLIGRSIENHRRYLEPSPENDAALLEGMRETAERLSLDVAA